MRSIRRLLRDDSGALRWSTACLPSAPSRCCSWLECSKGSDAAPGSYHASSTRRLTLAARITATACFAAYSGLWSGCSRRHASTPAR
jgi:hypothetical protein